MPEFGPNAATRTALQPWLKSKCERAITGRIAFSNAAFAPQQFPILGLPNVAPAQREPSKVHLC
jgi:hypothetical protein